MKRYFVIMGFLYSFCMLGSDLRELFNSENSNPDLSLEINELNIKTKRTVSDVSSIDGNALLRFDMFDMEELEARQLPFDLDVQYTDIVSPNTRRAKIVRRCCIMGACAAGSAVVGMVLYFIMREFHI